MSSDNPPQDRATAYASMEEWEKRCNDYSGETVHDLANEVLRLRAAANRTLNAFFCCEGLDNTHLMDAFSEWAVLMGHAAVPEAKAWIAKWEARRDR